MIANRILIADKDESLLATYREFLLRDGFDVVTATDGVDCVAKLRAFTPNILVLEPELPWGNGEGVLAMMYEEADVPQVPVMILSGSKGPEEDYGVGVFPVSAYHVKPMSPNLLAQSLRRLLRKERAYRRTREIAP